MGEWRLDDRSLQRERGGLDCREVDLDSKQKELWRKYQQKP